MNYSLASIGLNFKQNILTALLIAHAHNLMSTVSTRGVLTCTNKHTLEHYARAVPLSYATRLKPVGDNGIALFMSMRGV